MVRTILSTLSLSTRERYLREKLILRYGVLLPSLFYLHTHSSAQSKGIHLSALEI